MEQIQDEPRLPLHKGQGFKCGGKTIESELKNTLKAYGILDEDSIKLIMQVIEYAKTRTKNKKA